MRLYNVQLQGFRRFEKLQNLNVSSKLTAVIGPNEAGKTSLLKAISYFSSNSGIDSSDETNLGEEETFLKLSFFLDDADLMAAQLTEPSWLDLVKKVDGKIRYRVHPDPKRDITSRKEAIKAISQLQKSRIAIRKLTDITDITLDDLQNMLIALQDCDAPLPSHILALIDTVIDSIEKNALELKLKAIDNFVPTLTALKEFEDGYDPHQIAIEALVLRVPQILNFTEEFRNINLPYNLTNYNHEDPQRRQAPSRPLAEMIRLSEVNLDALKQAAISNNEAVKAGLLSAANKKLEEISRANWSQSDAALNFFINGNKLTVLVKNEKDVNLQSQFSDYEARSDGYKQFIALQIFAFLEKSSKSILLIDEIEQHLHYDAQADLIQILQDEPSVGNVVYTTHSAGSLPEDLGTGVRMIRWDDNHKNHSQIINKFWHEDAGAGFKPLLFGMGATTLAFFPTRRALVGEGPTEMLILPMILRSALGIDALDFQIVHGLSNINPSGLPMIDGDSNKVCYLTDGDAGGLQLRKSLEKAGVDNAKIFCISDIQGDLETVEDLLDEDTWLESVNRYIDMYGPNIGVLDNITSAPLFGRINALPKSFRKEKIALAYNVLDLVQENPNRNIVSRRLISRLRRFGGDIRVSLGLDADTLSKY